MFFSKSRLMRWGVLAGGVAFCGVAWYLTRIELKADAGSANFELVETMQKMENPVRLYGEMQYFSHRFANELQRLQTQPDVAHVQAF